HAFAEPFDRLDLRADELARRRRDRAQHERARDPDRLELLAGDECAQSFDVDGDVGKLGHYFFFVPPAFFFAAGACSASAAIAGLRSGSFAMPRLAFNASMRSITLPAGASGAIVISWPSTFLLISSIIRAWTSSLYFSGVNVSVAICWMICLASPSSAGLISGRSPTGISDHGLTSCA